MRFAARALLTLAMVAEGAHGASAAQPADPNLYLEEVDGPRALATVRKWNAATRTTLERQPGFADYRARALALLSTNQKIAHPDQILGQKVLNFWQDDQHPRGPRRADVSGGP